MDERKDERTENLPILQDFVPYRGRCPATAQLQPKNCIKRGKGTADHMMPLGDWLLSITDRGWTDGWTNKWKISLFYRSLSPIKAAAPLQLQL